MSQNRREFLRTIAAIGAGGTAFTSISPSKTAAQNDELTNKARKGVLVDATVCIGCRKCEWACKNAHNIEAGNFEAYQNDATLDKMRRPSTESLTIVNKYKDSETRTVKVQCMHCEHPACVSACIVGAFPKRKTERLVWDTDKCIGCRYCMVACPFQIPSFEYDKALDPEISKM